MSWFIVGGVAEGAAGIRYYSTLIFKRVDGSLMTCCFTSRVNAVNYIQNAFKKRHSTHCRATLYYAATLTFIKLKWMEFKFKFSNTFFSSNYRDSFNPIVYTKNFDLISPPPCFWNGRRVYIIKQNLTLTWPPTHTLMFISCTIGYSQALEWQLAL